MFITKCWFIGTQSQRLSPAAAQTACSIIWTTRQLQQLLGQLAKLPASLTLCLMLMFAEIFYLSVEDGFDLYCWSELRSHTTVPLNLHTISSRTGYNHHVADPARGITASMLHRMDLSVVIRPGGRHIRSNPHNGELGVQQTCTQAVACTAPQLPTVGSLTPSNSPCNPWVCCLQDTMAVSNARVLFHWRHWCCGLCVTSLEEHFNLEDVQASSAAQLTAAVTLHTCVLSNLLKNPGFLSTSSF